VGNGKFDPLPRPKPLADRHQKWGLWGADVNFCSKNGLMTKYHNFENSKCRTSGFIGCGVYR